MSGFVQPQKLISTQEDVARFSRSEARQGLEAFLNTLSRAVAGLEIPTEPTNAHVAQLVKVLEHLSDLADEIEPESGRQRFGNTAFRTWSERIQKEAPALLHTVSPGHPSWIELDHYFVNAFGSAQRLDYGTGHELNFLAFLGGFLLFDVGVDGLDILYTFANYFKLCQKLILRYNLEPAGSHGVWGLDDHFHIPYILGAAQLMFGGDNIPKPKDVLDKKLVAEDASKNLYFGAIEFIYRVKRGNFFEHSPILFDVSGVASWTKIHRGMLRMYVDEVFGKFTVIQHFWFGTIYSLRDVGGGANASN